MSLTPGLNLVMEEARSGISIILEQIITQVMKKVNGETIFFEKEFMHTLKLILKDGYLQLKICPLL